MTITEFLLARIAEDEAASREVRPDEYLTTRDDPSLGMVDIVGYAAVTITSGRVLAECEAKRRIVEAAHPQHLPLDSVDYLSGATYGLGIALRALALVYADHPDFDPAWQGAAA